MIKSLLLVCAGLSVLLLPGRQDHAKVGDHAPNFSIQDSTGRAHKLMAYRGKFIVFEWINKDCPYVKKFYDGGHMQEMQVKARGLGAVWLTICSSAQFKQGFMLSDEIQRFLTSSGSNANAYLLDHVGTIGRLFGARTSPQAVIIDPKGKIIYWGAIDDKPTTKPEDVKKARNHVLSALAEAMANQPVTIPTTQPYGSPIPY